MYDVNMIFRTIAERYGAMDLGFMLQCRNIRCREMGKANLARAKADLHQTAPVKISKLECPRLDSRTSDFHIVSPGFRSSKARVLATDFVGLGLPKGRAQRDPLRHPHV